MATPTSELIKKGNSYMFQWSKSRMATPTYQRRVKVFQLDVSVIEISNGHSNKYARKHAPTFTGFQWSKSRMANPTKELLEDFIKKAVSVIEIGSAHFNLKIGILTHRIQCFSDRNRKCPFQLKVYDQWGNFQ